jgi:hypothetical protein
MADNSNPISETPKSDESPEVVADYLAANKKKKKPVAHGGYFGQKGGYKDLLDQAGK